MPKVHFVEGWRRAVLASELPDICKLVATALARYANWRTGKDCFPSQEKLAGDIGKSVRSVRRGLRPLERRGFVKRIRRGRKRSNAYELVLP